MLAEALVQTLPQRVARAGYLDAGTGFWRVLRFWNKGPTSRLKAWMCWCVRIRIFR